MGNVIGDGHPHGGLSNDLIIASATQVVHDIIKIDHQTKPWQYHWPGTIYQVLRTAFKRLRHCLSLELLL